MIELKNVSFSYTDDRGDSLSSVNLKVNKGEFLLLCGRSGCGKSTVTRILNGLIPNFYEGNLRGQVLFDGIDVTERELHETAKQVGSVFQDPRSQFFTTDTTSEISFSCENMGIERSEMVKRLCETVLSLGISPLLDKSIFRLSSGEKQKIAIASVYAIRPNIYVLDEPSANLDFKSIEDLKEILRTLKRAGHTVIIAEHRLHYLMEFIDTIRLRIKAFGADMT